MQDPNVNESGKNCEHLDICIGCMHGQYKVEEAKNQIHLQHPLRGNSRGFITHLIS